MTLQATPEDLFTLLRAEREGAWLGRVFVSPEGVERVRGMQSVILVGADGVGKTALMEYLKGQSLHNPAGPLMVWWRPVPLPAPDALQSVNGFREQAFQETSIAALDWAGRFPHLVKQAPQYAQRSWVACVDAFIPPFQQERLLYEYPVLRELLSDLRARVDQTFSALFSIPSLDVLRAWVDALRAMGCLGVWVVVDGLEMWQSPESDALLVQMKHLLSSMVWFEQAGFALKILAPERFQKVLLSAIKPENKRIQPAMLIWSVEKLKEIVECRLHWITGKPEPTLETLVQDGFLLTVLKQYGGMLPRGWLDLTYPFVKAYLEKKSPLTMAEGEQILRKYPPRLRLDLQRKRVILGYSVWEVSPQSYDLLEYLYRQPDFSCTKEELYYRGIRRYENIPAPGSKEWEPPSDWWGVMDTALWRLRREIERDPGNPLYILSERRKGMVRLNWLW
ncbi:MULTISPECIES: hypothetical protein [Anaerolinea]|uniref:OmpR/PhoB-type domain-containing protein n=1 Tax=Anaerolinea thermophila (strain DSM 14523 / JCM 11388 / NBRC 100420 / UNI-1) TaxID=926569 RepID=E8N276_ANATU|nr:MULTISPECIES: hypothetical protein [Anaerolinea]BAJ65023.1 hypothetical protein ANT_29970 [Anaerolinea thermophila UNI-1]